jgi:hypothetical protein
MPRMQRHRRAIHDQFEALGKTGREAFDVRIALRLRRDAIAIRIRQVQLAQRRKLTEDHGVVHVHRSRREPQAAVLVDGKVSKQARHRVGAGRQRREREHGQHQQTGDGSEMLLKAAVHEHPLL